MPATRALAAALLFLLPTAAVAQPVGGATGDRQGGADPLEVVVRSTSVVTAFVVTPGGRRFMALSRIDGSAGPQLVEWAGGKETPFPEGDWNRTDGDDAGTRFVNVNAVRTGPHGALWIVDVGAPGFGKPKVPRGPKVVEVDLATNKVVKVFPLDSLTNATSRIDDIRFHGALAYITDAGSPGVIVLDLLTGAGRRVLDGDPSLTAQRPVTAEDHLLRGPDGAPVRIHVDQLEVSPDGKFFYYQPASGPMSRVATRYIDDPKLTEPQLAKHVTTFSRTGSTGGTAIDADGNIYCSDTQDHRVWIIDPNGKRSLLVEDPRLIWVDAMWIDDDGYLYMPAAQLDRMAPFNNGVSRVELPVQVFRMKIGAKPPASDHP